MASGQAYLCCRDGQTGTAESNLSDPWADRVDPCGGTRDWGDRGMRHQYGVLPDAGIYQVRIWGENLVRDIEEIRECIQENYFGASAKTLVMAARSARMKLLDCLENRKHEYQ